VAAIGPWPEQRLPPPPAGRARISLLVGPDLCFGEGPLEALSADPLGGPLMGTATALLQAVGDLAAAGGAASEISDVVGG
jgi:hypothetical protein